jgi:Predicted transcriptional regulators
MATFADRVKELRSKMDVTQVEVATKCDITTRAYQRLEAGHNPNHDSLIKLANYFSVSTDYLLGLSNDPKRY